MKSAQMVLAGMGLILGFFFGLFVCIVMATIVKLPHPEAFGTVAWIALLVFLCKSAYVKARDEREARTAAILASTERQAQEKRDANPLWDL